MTENTNNSSVYDIATGDYFYKIYLPDAETDYIQKKIAQEKKPYELEMLQDMQHRLNKGDLVLDVGSNIGNHALYLAATTESKIVAFEPNVHLCNSITESINLNDFSDRLEIRCVALGAAKGNAHFASQIPNNLGAQSIELGSGNINVISIDSIDFYRSVKLIKIDVEGMEVSVLQGAIETIKRDRPLLYIECLNEEQFRQVSKIMLDIGYGYWDTFNASPTHLFLAIADINADKIFARLQFKVEEAIYRLTHTVRDLKKKLDEANKKYRAVSEQLTDVMKKNWGRGCR